MHKNNPIIYQFIKQQYKIALVVFALGLVTGSALLSLRQIIRVESTAAFQGLQTKDRAAPPLESWWLNRNVLSPDDLTGDIQQRGNTAFYSHSAEDIDGFLPTNREKFIESVNLLPLSVTGSYTSTFTLAVEIRDFAGNIQHVVSASPIDLQSVVPGPWFTIPLSDAADDHIISPGEYLAIHATTNGEAAAGDFQIIVFMEAQVRDTDKTYLPVVSQ